MRGTESLWSGSRANGVDEVAAHTMGNAFLEIRFVYLLLALRRITRFSKRSGYKVLSGDLRVHVRIRQSVLR